MTTDGISLDTLIRKYDGRIPRYTSYPTAVELAPAGSIEEVTSAIASVGRIPASLYVHIPFCRSLCWFCACNKVVTRDARVVAPYIDDLRRELDIVTAAAGRKPLLSDIHFGGGSPSFLSADELETLCEILDSGCIVSESAEKSIELDPRTTTREQIEVLARRGFRRASLGVQDFNPKVQALVHRVQPYDLVKDVVDMLRENGVQSLNFDLIYGLPGQTLDSISKTMERVIELRPDRIALYGYAHVAWKAKAQRVFDKVGLASPNERIAFFSEAERIFTDAGYVPIGLDHFALATDDIVQHAERGTLRRNFMGYTTTGGTSVLGLGVSAVSDLGDVLYQNHSDLDRYSLAVRSGSLPISKRKARDADDRTRAYVIERLMCQGELRFGEVPDSLTEDVGRVLAEATPRLEELMRDGLVTWDSSGIHATFIGRLFLRSIAASFDRYLIGNSPSAFSSAV